MSGQPLDITYGIIEIGEEAADLGEFFVKQTAGDSLHVMLAE